MNYSSKRKMVSAYLEISKIELATTRWVIHENPQTKRRKYLLTFLGIIAMFNVAKQRNISSRFYSHINSGNRLSLIVSPPKLPIISQLITEYETAERNLLGCNDMKNIKIIREVSTGNQKIIYEVELPSGQKAIAKRCISHRCVKYGKVKQEGLYLKYLQQYFGRQKTIAHYGECDMPYNLTKLHTKGTGNRYLKSIASNFTRGGYTSIIELGKILIPTMGGKEMDMNFRQCFASHFTDADLENIRSIARQYASYPESPLLFHDPEIKSHNACAEQYVVVDAGIRHVDLDQIFLCKDCTYDKALEINCRTIRVLSHRPDLNCTLAYSLEHPVNNMSIHINARETHLECNAKNMTKAVDRGGKLKLGC